MAVAVIAVVVGGVAVVVLWTISAYNGLVTLATSVDNDWAQIDVQLTRRHDLIPNLVETVKGYAQHESQTLEAVVAARNAAVSASGPAAKGTAERGLSSALGRIFAVAESYPDLKANQSFLALQNELSATEDRIASARSAYNAGVEALNAKRAMFPTSMIAEQNPKFAAREYYAAHDPEVQAVPEVNFS
jgi:LemA protein